MIEQILKPIFKPIKRIIIAPLKRAKTLPKRMLVALRKWLVTAIFGPLRSLSNYLRIGSYFIAKKLIALVLVITLIIVYFGFISPPAFINKWFGRTPQLEASVAANGSFTGPASILDAEGKLQFEGQLENGQYSGAGKLYYANGNLRYQGDFDQGMMAGSGELFNEEGILLYRGQFAGDQYAGEGTLFYASGKSKYVGQFVAGDYEGAGTAYNEEGSIIYAGAFLKGAYSGDGKLYSAPDKLLYEGQFNNGIYEGAGKLFDNGGALVYEGIFLAGKLTGVGKHYFASGFVKYEGAFLLGNYHGIGSLFNETGSVIYTGSFANGEQNGTGQSFNASGGIVYDGKFVNSKYEGVGAIYDVDGAVLYKGFFRNGSLYAEGFMNLSLAKLQETLGVPDAPVSVTEDVLVDEGLETELTEPDLITETDATTDRAIPEATTLVPETVQASASPTTDTKVEAVAIPTPTAIPTLTPNGSEGQTPVDPELATEVILPQTLTFSALQMSVIVEVDEDNPESFFVRNFTTWNATVMEQTYSRLLIAKAVSTKETLENGRTNIIFKSGNILLTFLLNKDKPVRLVMTSILTEE